MDVDSCGAIRVGPPIAQVAELVDAQVSGTCGRMVVEVRVFSWAPSSDWLTTLEGLQQTMSDKLNNPNPILIESIPNRNCIQIQSKLSPNPNPIESTSKQIESKSKIFRIP